MLLIIQKSPLGRNALIKELGLNESTIKTMQKRLKEQNLIRATTRGSTPTKKGNNIAQQITEHIQYETDIDLEHFTKEKNNILYHIKNPKKQIESITRLRDSAIKEGATSLIALKKEEHNLKIIGIEEKIDPPKEIENILKPKKEDIILIISANSIHSSRRAGLKLALDIIDFKLE